MAKIIFDPSTIAKSADVNANFAGTWNGTLIDDEAIHKRHLHPDAVPTVRKYAQTSPSTLAVDAANYELFVASALANGVTLGNPTGTVEDGAAVMFRIRDNGTQRSISYGSAYRAMGVTLPTLTVPSKWIYMLARWNDDDDKWDILSVGRQG